MLKAVLLQVLIVLAAAALTGIWLGGRGVVSVLLGGMAYALPNLVFVLRMKIASVARRASAVTFFVGEFLKVAATIGILVVAQKFYDVQWVALLVGLFAALKANLFAFLLKT